MRSAAHPRRLASRTRRAFCCAATIALLVPSAGGRAASAADYPTTMVLDATASNGTTTITSILTIRLDRLMEESRRKRVADALKFNGYSGFLTTLRSLPAVGTIELEKRKVDIRYAQQLEDSAGRRLVLVGDRPLFFLGSDPAKARAGFELTMVDLRVDGAGGVTGTMAGAARVKPSPEGVVLDTFGDVPVKLASHTTRP